MSRSAPARYTVAVTPQATVDLRAIREYLGLNAPDYVDRFLDRVSTAFEGLERFPFRHPRARESASLRSEIRQAMVDSHRILFAVRGSTVFVLRVGHASRDQLP